MAMVPANEAITDAILSALRAIDGTGDFNFDLTGDDAVLEATPSAIGPTIDGYQVILAVHPVDLKTGVQMGHYGQAHRFEVFAWAPSEDPDIIANAVRRAHRLLNDCTLAIQRLRAADPVVAALAKGYCIDVELNPSGRTAGDELDREQYGGLGLAVAEVIVTAEVTEGL